MKPPTFHDVLLARRRIAPFLARTPLHRYPAVDALLGTTAYIKHDNYHPTGSFKVRGGVNLLSQLSEDEQAREVIAVSTGNHGQSVAYAAKLFNVQAHIVMPVKANPGKVAAIRGMGAEVIFHGASFDAARLYCEDLVKARGYRYVQSANEPHLIAGVATEILEMLEDEPELEVLLVPIGGGSQGAGACIVAQAVNPRLQVIGVQSEASPAACESWRQKKLVEAGNTTFAEGLAVGTGFALPQEILWQSLSDFILVSDDEIRQAMVWMIEHAHTLAEEAGAVSLAAAYKLREELKGKKIGVICSGGNVSLQNLTRALQLTDLASLPSRRSYNHE